MGIFGDLEPEATYAAVGRALSSWEQIEIALAHVYSIFEGVPGQLDMVREFGDMDSTFGRRLAKLSGPAFRYFARHPSQENEGDFANICKDAESLAKTRNKIAHGVVSRGLVRDPVEGITDNSKLHLRYMLMAPWFSSERLGMNASAGISSVELLAHAEEFSVMRGHIDELIKRMTV